MIEQVVGEFLLQGIWVSLAKTTINDYVACGSIRQFPIRRGYGGMIPQHAFRLLVLAVESKIPINQVNSGLLERLDIIHVINSYCGMIQELGGVTVETLFERMMWATTVWLNITILPPVEEWRLH